MPELVNYVKCKIFEKSVTTYGNCFIKRNTIEEKKKEEENILNMVIGNNNIALPGILKFDSSLEDNKKFQGCIKVENGVPIYGTLFNENEFGTDGKNLDVELDFKNVIDNNFSNVGKIYNSDISSNKLVTTETLGSITNTNVSVIEQPYQLFTKDNKQKLSFKKIYFIPQEEDGKNKYLVKVRNKCSTSRSGNYWDHYANKTFTIIEKNKIKFNEGDLINKSFTFYNTTISSNNDLNNYILAMDEGCLVLGEDDSFTGNSTTNHFSKKRISFLYSFLKFEPNVSKKSYLVDNNNLIIKYENFKKNILGASYYVNIQITLALDNSEYNSDSFTDNDTNLKPGTIVFSYGEIPTSLGSPLVGLSNGNNVSTDQDLINFDLYLDKNWLNENGFGLPNLNIFLGLEYSIEDIKSFEQSVFNNSNNQHLPIIENLFGNRLNNYGISKLETTATSIYQKKLNSSDFRNHINNSITNTNSDLYIRLLVNDNQINCKYFDFDNTKEYYINIFDLGELLPEKIFTAIQTDYDYDLANTQYNNLINYSSINGKTSVNDLVNDTLDDLSNIDKIFTCSDGNTPENVSAELSISINNNIIDNVTIISLGNNYQNTDILEVSLNILDGIFNDIITYQIDKFKFEYSSIVNNFSSFKNELIGKTVHSKYPLLNKKILNYQKDDVFYTCSGVNGGDNTTTKSRIGLTIENSVIKSVNSFNKHPDLDLTNSNTTLKIDNLKNYDINNQNNNTDINLININKLVKKENNLRSSITTSVNDVGKTFTNLTTISENGTAQTKGSGAILTITTLGTNINTTSGTITVTTPGSGYQVGNILKLSEEAQNKIGSSNNLEFLLVLLNIDGDIQNGGPLKTDQSDNNLRTTISKPITDAVINFINLTTISENGTASSKGEGAILNITPSGQNINNTSGTITVTNIGSGYQVGNILKLSEQAKNELNIINNLVFTLQLGNLIGLEDTSIIHMFDLKYPVGTSLSGSGARIGLKITDNVISDVGVFDVGQGYESGEFLNIHGIQDKDNNYFNITVIETENDPQNSIENKIFKPNIEDLKTQFINKEIKNFKDGVFNFSCEGGSGSDCTVGLKIDNSIITNIDSFNQGNNYAVNDILKVKGIRDFTASDLEIEVSEVNGGAISKPNLIETKSFDGDINIYDINPIGSVKTLSMVSDLNALNIADITGSSKYGETKDNLGNFSKFPGIGSGLEFNFVITNKLLNSTNITAGGNNYSQDDIIIFYSKDTNDNLVEIELKVEEVEYSINWKELLINPNTSKNIKYDLPIFFNNRNPSSDTEETESEEKIRNFDENIWYDITHSEINTESFNSKIHKMFIKKKKKFTYSTLLNDEGKQISNTNDYKYHFLLKIIYILNKSDQGASDEEINITPNNTLINGPYHFNPNLGNNIYDSNSIKKSSFTFNLNSLSANTSYIILLKDKLGDLDRRGFGITYELKKDNIVLSSSDIKSIDFFNINFKTDTTFTDNTYKLIITSDRKIPYLGIQFKELQSQELDFLISLNRGKIFKIQKDTTNNNLKYLVLVNTNE